MDETEMEKKIESLAVTALRALKGICVENKYDDKKATLILYYFLNRFVKNGWKGKKPSLVLENVISVIKEINDDNPIPFTPKN